MKKHWTVQEVAKELNISRQAVYKHLTPTFRQQYTTKVNNKLTISLKGINSLKSRVKPQINDNEESTVDSDIDNLKLSKIISILQSELTAKNEEIVILHQLLDQQQQLTLQSNKQIESLTNRLALHHPQKFETNAGNTATAQNHKEVDSINKPWWKLFQFKS